MSVLLVDVCVRFVRFREVLLPTANRRAGHLGNQFGLLLNQLTSRDEQARVRVEAQLGQHQAHGIAALLFCDERLAEVVRLLTVLWFEQELSDVAGIRRDLRVGQVDVLHQELSERLAGVHRQRERLPSGEIFQRRDPFALVDHDAARAVLNRSHDSHDIRLLDSPQ